MKTLSHLFLAVVAATVVAVLGFSCSKPKPEELAGQTAKLYYDYLLSGKYDAYVDGFYQPDDIPESYRSQLIDNAQMFMGQQQKERGGISGVQFLRATVSNDGLAAHVFLLLSFADSTKEEVVVPMQSVNGNWMMK